MLFSVEQAFVGRDEKRAPLQNPCVGGQVVASLTFDWIKFRGSHAIHGRVTSLVAKQVCLGPLKRATRTDFVTKSRTNLYFLQQLSTTSQDRFDAWVIKRAISLLNSFCSNIVKQVTCFFCSFYRTFRGGFISKYSHHCQAKSRKLTRLPSSLHYRGWCQRVNTSFSFFIPNNSTARGR